MNFTAINTRPLNGRRRAIVVYPPLANPSLSTIFIRSGDLDWNETLVLPVGDIDWEMTLILSNSIDEDYPSIDYRQSIIGDI